MIRRKFLYVFFRGFVLSISIGAYVSCSSGKGRAITGILVAEAYCKLPERSIDLAEKTDPLLSSAASGLDTQVLLGDRLHIVNNNIKHGNAKWAEVKLLDQATYKKGAWKPKTCFMISRDCFLGGTDWQPNAVVTNGVAAMFAKPHVDALQLGRLSIGTRIKAKKEVHHGWVEVTLASGVTGWVKSSDIITDDALSKWTPLIKRDLLMKAAKQFVGSPYRWGCSSGFDTASPALTGVDCSGLVYLAYRAIGLQVPRDAHDQFLAASPLKSGSDLKLGDLIFIAKINAEKNEVKVHHVMIYAGSDRVFESTGLGASALKDLVDPKQACTRFIAATKHRNLKKSLKDIWHSQLNESGEFVFFGTFLGDKATYAQLTKGLI